MNERRMYIVKVAIFATLLFGSNVGMATVPNHLRMDGFLSRSSDGAPIDGNVNFTVRIYNEASCLMMTESHTAVVSNGEFALSIGSNSPTINQGSGIGDVFDNNIDTPCATSATEKRRIELDFTVTSGPDTGLTESAVAGPLIHSVPYSFFAQEAAQALALANALPLSNIDSSGCATNEVITFDGSDFGCAPIPSPGPGSIGNTELGTNAVQTANIQDDAVNSAKIQDGSIANADISDLDFSKLTGFPCSAGEVLESDGSGGYTCVTNGAALGADSVALVNMQDDSVDTAELVNGAVTFAKIDPGIDLTTYVTQNISSMNDDVGCPANELLRRNATDTAWECVDVSTIETDPIVAMATADRLPRWDGTNLIDSAIYDDGTVISLDSPTYILSLAGDPGTLGTDNRFGIYNDGTSFYLRGRTSSSTDVNVQLGGGGGGISNSAGNNNIPKSDGTNLVASTIYDDGTSVGIGSATPNVALDVVGGGSFTGDLNVDGNTLFVDSANNRVGIGMNPVASQLEVAGNGYMSGDLAIGGNSALNGDVVVGTDELVIDTTGSWIGIGTSVPSGGVLFDVDGSMSVNGDINTIGSIGITSGQVLGFGGLTTAQEVGLANGDVWFNTDTSLVNYYDGAVQSLASQSYVNSNLAGTSLPTPGAPETNQYLQWDGANWVYNTPAGSGPAGNSSEIQLNNAGAFGTDSSFVYQGGRLGIGTDSPAYELDMPFGGARIGNYASIEGDVSVGTLTRNEALTVNGAFSIAEMIAPTGDVAGYGMLYVDSGDSGLKFRDDLGNITDLTSSGSSAAGSGQELQYNDGSGNFSASPRLFIDETSYAPKLAMRMQNGAIFAEADESDGEPANGDDIPGLVVKKTANNSAFSPIIEFERARGTLGSPSDVQDGDKLMKIEVLAEYSGSNSVGGMEMMVDGPPVGGVPSSMILKTSDNTGSNSERLRITSSGDIGIGTSSPNARLHVDSSGSPMAIFAVGPAGADERFHFDNNGELRLTNPIGGHTVSIRASDVSPNTLQYYDGASWLDVGSGGSGSAGGGGAVQFSNGGGGFAADPSEFYWDNGGFQLGLGTTAPGAKIELNNGGAPSGNSMLKVVSTTDRLEVDDYGHVATLGKVKIGTPLADGSGAKLEIDEPTGGVPMLDIQRTGASVFTVNSDGEVYADGSMRFDTAGSPGFQSGTGVIYFDGGNFQVSTDGGSTYNPLGGGGVSNSSTVNTIPRTDGGGNLIASGITDDGTEVTIDGTTRDFAVDTNTLFVDSSINNVGIGNSAPNARLHVMDVVPTGPDTNVFRVQTLMNSNAFEVQRDGDVDAGKDLWVTEDTYLNRRVYLQSGAETGPITESQPHIQAQGLYPIGIFMDTSNSNVNERGLKTIVDGNRAMSQSEYYTIFRSVDNQATVYEGRPLNNEEYLVHLSGDGDGANQNGDAYISFRDADGEEHTKKLGQRPFFIVHHQEPSDGINDGGSCTGGNVFRNFNAVVYDPANLVSSTGTNVVINVPGNYYCEVEAAGMEIDGTRVQIEGPVGTVFGSSHWFDQANSGSGMATAAGIVTINTSLQSLQVRQFCDVFDPVAGGYDLGLNQNFGGMDVFARMKCTLQ